MLGRRRFFMDVTNGRKIGRPPKYTKEEAKKVRNKQHNENTRRNYDFLQTWVTKGMNERIAEACKKENMSKASYVISALEERLEKTNKISS